MSAEPCSQGSVPCCRLRAEKAGEKGRHYTRASQNQAPEPLAPQSSSIPVQTWQCHGPVYLAILHPGPGDLWNYCSPALSASPALPVVLVTAPGTEGEVCPKAVLSSLGQSCPAATLHQIFPHLTVPSLTSLFKLHYWQ